MKDREYIIEIMTRAVILLLILTIIILIYIT